MALGKTENPSTQLEDHLASQIKLKEREADFDMEDGPEAHVLAPFKELQAALLWLETNLTGAWRSANQDALRSHSRHRRLARLAIGAGTAAIVLAIVQLSTKVTLLKMEIEPLGLMSLFSSPDHAGLSAGALTAARLGVIPALLEIIAVAAGLTAVGVGLAAKFDRRWLSQRHRGERLRMLKFRSLGQLWCLEPSLWRETVTKRLATLEEGDDPKNTEEWLSGELVEPFEQDSLKFEPSPATACALSAYYRFKRVEFQANYFNRRREVFKKESGPWLHLSLPLFLASVACVVVHFALELWAEHLHLQKPPSKDVADYLEAVATWFVSMAAIIPVLGIGMRAWFAAFELPRSANLFAAKYRALKFLTDRLKEDADNVGLTLGHMTRAEYFLEQEHREWLRLLRDTEWFL